MQPSTFVPRPARAWGWRGRRALPAAVAAAALAACGGGGGDGGGTEPPPPATTAVFNVAASFSVASGTSGLSLRVTPTYVRTTGDAGTLAAVTVDVPTANAQTLPVTVNLAPCLNDAQHAGGAGACQVRLELALSASGGRAIDAVAVGPNTVQAGTTNAVSASFVEVAGVRVSLNSTVIADGGAASVQVGQTLALRGVAVDPASNALDARAVQWTSEAPGVATVDAATGTVTGVTAGTARVVAASAGRTSAVLVTVTPPPPRTLTITLPGTGTGRVTSDPAGVDCRAAGTAGCSAPFTGGTQVTLTAAPDANSEFTGWGGACSGTQVTCAVTMSEARTVSATFARRRVTITLTAASDRGGRGTINLTGASVQNGTCTTTGTTVTCQATANVGASVTASTSLEGVNGALEWTGGQCTGSSAIACTFTATADVAVGTTFVPAIPVTVLGAGGGTYQADVVVTGTLSGRPYNTNNIAVRVSSADAGPQTDFVVDLGTTATIRVNPIAPGRSVAWGAGACASATNTTNGAVATCTFTATATSTITFTVGP